MWREGGQMPGDLKIISVDDHVLEPKTVWLAVCEAFEIPEEAR